jgi:hypothetical protein
MPARARSQEERAVVSFLRVRQVLPPPDCGHDLIADPVPGEAADGRMVRGHLMPAR